MTNIVVLSYSSRVFSLGFFPADLLLRMSELPKRSSILVNVNFSCLYHLLYNTEHTASRNVSVGPVLFLDVSSDLEQQFRTLSTSRLPQIILESMIQGLYSQRYESGTYLAYLYGSD